MMKPCSKLQGMLKFNNFFPTNRLVAHEDRDYTEEISDEESVMSVE